MKSLKSLFTRKKETAEDAHKPLQYALIEGLNQMRTHDVDRITLALCETEGDENARGRWIESGETRYYPPEFLPEAEQEMINEGKSYKSIALVLEQVGNFVTYPMAGVEVTDRTHGKPALCELESEYPLNYVTNGGVYSQESLEEFAKWATNLIGSLTPERVKGIVEEGIQR